MKIEPYCRKVHTLWYFKTVKYQNSKIVCQLIRVIYWTQCLLWAWTMLTKCQWKLFKCVVKHNICQKTKCLWDLEVRNPIGLAVGPKTTARFWWSSCCSVCSVLFSVLYVLCIFVVFRFLLWHILVVFDLYVWMFILYLSPFFLVVVILFKLVSIRIFVFLLFYL